MDDLRRRLPPRHIASSRRVGVSQTPSQRIAAWFREELVEAGGNRLLAGMHAQIRTRLNRYQAAMAQPPHLPETPITEHVAIAAGDVSKAGALARAHPDGLVAQMRLNEDAAEPATRITKIRTSHRPRPRTACCHQGPGSLAASARIRPVLRRSSPSQPSRNSPADVAKRSCVNKGRIRAFISRSKEAQSSNVVSIDTPAIP